jgi:hypothetical protein
MTKPEWQERMKKLLAGYDPFRNIELFEELVTESLPINTWEEFQRWFAQFNGGCFRGHRNASWNLFSTLDRALQKTVKVDTPDIQSTSWQKMNPEANEGAVLLEFQRGAHHHHHSPTPPIDEVVDWLALMQHHGAPTRLLDWTLSPYVALYFALQGESEGDAALWAIDLRWLSDRSNELLRQNDENCPDGSDFYAIGQYINRILFGNDNLYIVIPTAPKQLNERMLTQQGQLLCNLRHDVGFSTSLLGMLIRPAIVEQQVVSKVVLKRDQRIMFLEELRRMNIHSASLFPGLDGFARSLAVNLEISVAHQIEAHKQAVIEQIREARQRKKLTQQTPLDQ